MLSTSELREVLNNVITIPLIPFRQGKIDYQAHERNIRYLMSNNHLSNHRQRIICVAGTSLINHITDAEQMKLLESTASAMQGEGVLLSALMPNPLQGMSEMVDKQSALERVPDAYLIMPVGGVYSSEGLYEDLMKFGDKHGRRHGSKFLFYHRQPRDQEAIIRLMRRSEHFVGLKVGTSVDDVPALVDEVGDKGIVIWGIGDRSTTAAEKGTLGHTSGISVIYAKAGDLINNAQRIGDYGKSRQIEERISALEELRFMAAREYNYSAVLEAMILSRFEDIDGGEGGPFNPRVPKDVSKKVAEAIEGLEDLH